MGKRHPGHRFMPDVMVFPGGRVDPDDHRGEAISELRAEPMRLLERRATPARARALGIAAARELFEETGVRADLVDVLARSRDEHFYDLPDDMIGRIWKGKYRGQRQNWFLMRFKGTDADINIETEHREFSSWQWVDAPMLPQLIVPFKKRLYENILAEFADLI
jgi:putative (di)nucleoside polyphosphate hydrolase